MAESAVERSPLMDTDEGGAAAHDALRAVLGDARQGRRATTPPRVEHWVPPGGAWRSSLRLTSWGLDGLPSGAEPRALVVFVHGFCHYMDSFYARLATDLNDLGVACAGFDLPGHNESGPTPGSVPPLDTLASLVCEVRNKAVTDLVGAAGASPGKTRALATVPVILYGESLGGAVAIKAAADHPSLFQGAALMWPMVGVASSPSGLVKAVLGCVACVAPCIPIRGSSPPDANTFSDPSKQAQASADPGRYAGSLRADTAWSFVNAWPAVKACAEDVACPVLVTHSAADAVTSPSASREWFDRVASGAKEYHLFEEGAHNLWWEPIEVRQRLWRLVSGFVDKVATAAGDAPGSEWPRLGSWDGMPMSTHVATVKPPAVRSFDYDEAAAAPVAHGSDDTDDEPAAAVTRR